MKIYMIRHGQTEANLKRVHYGQTDLPLTPLGIEQAAEAGVKLRGISFDKIYASDLIRARQTADTAIPGCTYETDARLREINIGKPLVGKNRAECIAEFGDVYTNAMAAHDFTPFGGESRAMHRERVREFFDSLAESAAGCERIAIFSHGGTMTSAVDIIFGAYTNRGLDCPNCCIAIFELNDGNLTLCSWNV